METARRHQCRAHPWFYQPGGRSDQATRLDPTPPTRSPYYGPPWIVHDLNFRPPRAVPIGFLGLGNSQHLCSICTGLTTTLQTLGRRPTLNYTVLIFIVIMRGYSSDGVTNNDLGKTVLADFALALASLLARSLRKNALPNLTHLTAISATMC
jgi:hypothetical protein